MRQAEPDRMCDEVATRTSFPGGGHLTIALHSANAIHGRSNTIVELTLLDNADFAQSEEVIQIKVRTDLGREVAARDLMLAGLRRAVALVLAEIDRIERHRSPWTPSTRRRGGQLSSADRSVVYDEIGSASLPIRSMALSRRALAEVVELRMYDGRDFDASVEAIRTKITLFAEPLAPAADLGLFALRRVASQLVVAVEKIFQSGIPNHINDKNVTLSIMS